MKFEVTDNWTAAFKEMVSLAKSKDAKVHVKAESVRGGLLGVFEVYPGGRAIYWSNDKGRLFDRKLKMATNELVLVVVQ